MSTIGAITASAISPQATTRLPALDLKGLNAGGASDKAEAVTTAVINKRAGGTGLITGRKAFQRPMNEGIEILNAVQDVYLSDDVTIA